MITFKVTANQSKRHFTIWKNSSKYRTIEYSQKEFENMEYYTMTDWKYFFGSTDEYYLVTL
tara:strand:+ start:370 stop:552 length:183 start_codon:yes stop_codon:yes gene_type:complete